MAGEKEKEEEKSVYHLDLVPGNPVKRSEWDLLFQTDAPVGLDFYHTDMMERVVVITVKKAKEEAVE